jgi:hypothetical protein
MGQVLHDCATTTEAVRRTIQHSQAGLRVLAKRYGINQKTVAKWKKRTSIADLPTGPKDAKSTVLSVEDEAIVVALPYLCQNKAIGGFQISGENGRECSPSLAAIRPFMQAQNVTPWTKMLATYSSATWLRPSRSRFGASC